MRLVHRSYESSNNNDTVYVFSGNYIVSRLAFIIVNGNVTISAYNQSEPLPVITATPGVGAINIAKGSLVISGLSFSGFQNAFVVLGDFSSWIGLVGCTFDSNNNSEFYSVVSSWKLSISGCNSSSVGISVLYCRAMG